MSPLASAVGPSRAVEQLRLSSCTAVADHFGSWQRLTTMQLNALLFVLCCAGANTPWLQHAHLCSRKWWTPCCTSTKPGPVPACEGPCTRNEAWCPWQRCLPCEALCAKLLLSCWPHVHHPLVKCGLASWAVLIAQACIDGSGNSGIALHCPAAVPDAASGSQDVPAACAAWPVCCGVL